jgi:Transposase DDE domain group 1
MSEDTLLPFDLPSVARKKVNVGFDGGQLSADAGVLVLRSVEKKLGLAVRPASCIRDRRKAERIEHPLEEMLRLRIFAIAAGYEDANNCDSLRHNPIQDGGRPCPGERRPFVLAAHDVAAGECAVED